MVVKLLSKKIDKEELDAGIIFDLKYGTLFLFFGILLGAIWADYSWGRFWAWDPKETWSLIAFLVYMLLFHALRARMIPKPYTYVYVSLSFLSILMA